MGFSYLIAGCIFFFLPNFNIMDIMPDFIGCLLILKGLSKISDLTPRLYDTREMFTKALYLYIAKFVLSFSVPYFANKDDGYILIFTFTFAVLETCLVIPAFAKMLEGLTHLGDRADTPVVFRSHGELNTISYIFLYVKTWLPVLPDLSYISKPEYSQNVTSNSGFYLSNYRTLLVSFSFLVTVVIGIIWLSYVIKYFSSLNNDKAFILYLQKKYETEVLTNKGLFIRRNIKSSFFIMTIGLFFMLDFLIDNVNVIPDFIAGLFILISSIMLRKNCNTNKMTAFSIVFLSASFFSWTVLCIYAIRFPAVNLWSNYEAYKMFTLVNIVNIIKYITLIPLLFFVYSTVKSVIKTYAGASIDDMEKVAFVNNQKQNAMFKMNKTSLWLGLISCVFSVVRMILLYELPVFWLFDFIFNLIWFIYIYKTLDTVKSAVEYRFM